MENITGKENEIIEIIRKFPFLSQDEIAKKLGISRSAVAGHLARLIKKGYLQRGYILNNSINGIAVIGGANIDIIGYSDSSFSYGTSNPGTIYKSAGGVARNVAENLGRLQLPTTLFTAVGQDEEGDWLVNHTANAGVNIEYVNRITGEKTGTYLSLLDQQREQIGSVSDMSIMDSFDIDSVRQISSVLLTAKIIFIDTNLPYPSLSYLFQFLKNKGIPIVVDPVSVKKSTIIKDFLPFISIITPNKEEAEALTGISIQSKEHLKEVAAHFFDEGVEQVIVTLGAEGVYIANREADKYISSPTVNVLDTTGAGDSFIAGVLYGLYKELNLFEACIYGQSMAAITLGKIESVASDLTNVLLEKTVEELYQK